jgi:hypothetical protein
MVSRKLADGITSKMNSDILEMKKIMVIFEKDIDVKKRRLPTVKMYHERPKPSNYYEY